MKELNMQIRWPQTLVTLGIVLMAARVLGFQQYPTTESGHSGKMSSQLMKFRPSLSMEISEASRRQSTWLHPPW
jgi:hypothetical protein